LVLRGSSGGGGVTISKAQFDASLKQHTCTTKHTKHKKAQKKRKKTETCHFVTRRRFGQIHTQAMLVGAPRRVLLSAARHV
jgi:hypothetical protein